jgi:arylsulfatase A-like enzyme
MFSGLYPDRHGIRENDSFKVPKRENRKYTLLAEDLRAAGFRTAAFVSAQPMERRFGLAAGFDVWDEPDPRTARGGGQRFRERRARETAGKVAAHARAGLAPRSFLFVHFFDPHAPYEPEERSPALPGGVWGDYLGEVMAVDQAIGEILAALPNGGRDAWVIVTADHGEGLGEHGEESHGFLLHDATLEVPLVVRPPARFDARLPGATAGGSRLFGSAAAGRLTDVAPTILALAGIEKPGLDGRSLVVLRGEDDDRPAFRDRAETLYGWYQFRYARLRAFRDAGAKLVEGGGRSELYDLRPDPASAKRADPGELRDVAAARPEEVARLRKLLLDALATAPKDEAQSTFEVPDLSGPYVGGRPAGTAIEPTEDENARLPRVQDRWNVVTDLEIARAHLRRGEPGKATLVLKAHAGELATNPALLFWTARSHHEVGASGAGSPEARLAELATAARHYRDLRTRFLDARGLDSELLVLRERHAITGDAVDLTSLVKLADGEIAAGGGSSLTFALRGVAKRDVGDLVGAESDLRRAAELDPTNLRAAEDLESVRRKLRD